HRAVILVVALLLMRALATVLTVAGGGAGGLFIPLVVEGALVGRTLGGLFRTAASGSNLSQLFMGSASASAHQMAARAGHLERRRVRPAPGGEGGWFGRRGATRGNPEAGGNPQKEGDEGALGGPGGSSSRPERIGGRQAANPPWLVERSEGADHECEDPKERT